MFSRSTDAGLSWSAPQRLSPQQTAAAFTPSVAVRSDGTLAVTYYDLRSDTIDPTTLPADLWLAVSSDQGATWREQRLSGPFDLATAPIARGYFLGDYHGLVASSNAFVPFFVQTNGAPTNRTDVYSARLVPTLMASDSRRSSTLVPATPAADFGNKVSENLRRQLDWRRLDRLDRHGRPGMQR